MEVQCSKTGDHVLVCIDGRNIPNVTDYKITSSMRGGTELVLNIQLQSEITEFATSSS